MGAVAKVVGRGRASSGDARILLVDDHPVVRRGLGELIRSEPGLSVCGEAEVFHYGVGGGHIFSPDEIYEEIRRVYRLNKKESLL